LREKNENRKRFLALTTIGGTKFDMLVLLCDICAYPVKFLVEYHSINIGDYLQ